MNICLRRRDREFYSGLRSISVVNDQFVIGLWRLRVEITFFFCRASKKKYVVKRFFVLFFESMASSSSVLVILQCIQTIDSSRFSYAESSRVDYAIFRLESTCSSFSVVFFCDRPEHGLSKLKSPILRRFNQGWQVIPPIVNPPLTSQTILSVSIAFFPARKLRRRQFRIGIFSSYMTGRTKSALLMATT